MQREHVGNFLRRQREARGMTLAELSRATKIKEASLAALEEARYDALPARVFVVGYVGAYAKAVGANEREARERLEAEAPPVALGDIGVECMPKVVAKAPEESRDARQPASRGRVGMVVWVFLLLIVATLTLSLLLHHGGRVGGGMS